MSRQLQSLRNFPVAGAAVFDAPCRPALHQSAFLARCLKRFEASTR